MNNAKKTNDVAWNLILSFWMNILSIAGSKSQAIEEVLAATSKEKNTAIKIFFKNFAKSVSYFPVL